MEKFKISEPQKRLNGTLPKIGIRPVIDGRRKGVRESLEGADFRACKNFGPVYGFK